MSKSLLRGCSDRRGHSHQWAPTSSTVVSSQLVLGLNGRESDLGPMRDQAPWRRVEVAYPPA